MSENRKQRTEFRPTLGGPLEERIAAAQMPGMRSMMTSAFQTRRQPVFAQRFAPAVTVNRFAPDATAARFGRLSAVTRFGDGPSPSGIRPPTHAEMLRYTPGQPGYQIAPGPIFSPLGNLDNYVVRY